MQRYNFFVYLQNVNEKINEKVCCSSMVVVVKHTLVAEIYTFGSLNRRNL